MSDAISFFTQDLADVPADDDWLSRGEKEVLARLRIPKRRSDWRMGRWTAKLLVLDYLGRLDRLDLPAAAGLSDVEIIAAADGAPEVFLQGRPAGVSVSISHAGGRGFCCAAPADVALGCDIEQLEPRGEAMLADFFTSGEIVQVCAVAPESQTLMANLIWSAKESMLKALREGLRRDTRSVVVEPVSLAAPCEWNRWRGRCLQSGRLFNGRWIAADRFVQTVATDSPLDSPLQNLIGNHRASGL